MRDWQSAQAYLTIVRDWQSAQAYLAHGRSKRDWRRNDRPLTRNTRLQYRPDTETCPPHPDGDIAVMYHSTDVVTYHQSGQVTVNAGGWGMSPTTRNRINRYTPSAVVPDVFSMRNRLWFRTVIDFKPIKRIRCRKCHGAWANPVVAVFEGQPECSCRTWGPYPDDGYVIVGGGPIYREWDGTPVTFNPDGTLADD